MTRTAAPSDRRRGSASVEMAFALTFLMLPFLLGLWEVGRMVEVKQLLSNAAREGGRQAASGLLTNAQVTQVVVNYLQDAGLPTQNVQVTVADLTSPGTDAAVATQFDRMQVSVTMPFDDVRLSAPRLVTSSSTTLLGSSTWRSMKDKPYGSPPQPPIE